MIPLTADTVRLGAAPGSKEQAVRDAADLLAAAGSIDPRYAGSMLGREKVANTFLGEGIAIPHGLLKDRDLIKSTAIAVVQVPDGVEWNPGETVRLVVGIAAASDEHLQILANLTRILSDPAKVEELSTTTDPQVIVTALSGGPAPGTGAAPGTTGGAEDRDLSGYRSTEVRLDLPSGLHARPATAFVDIAKGFAADVRVRRGGSDRVANGKSLASLLSLGADAGSTLTLLADGADADAALDALRAAVAGGLGEHEAAAEDATTAAAAPATVAWTPTGTATSIPGIGVSPGLAIGPVWHLKREKLVVGRTARDPQAEQRRLRSAIEVAKVELRDLHDEVEVRSGASKASIFRAHEAFLDDPELIDEVDRRVSGGESAGWAWRAVIDERAGELERVDDPVLAARAVDMHDVGIRVLRQLAEVDEDAPPLPDHPVVLLADDLTPSDTAAIDPARVLGFGTAAGGPTSHTAIIARALGIPAIVGAGPAVLSPAVGTTVVLDGAGGTLWLGVDEGDLDAAAKAQAGIEEIRAEQHRTRFQPAMTTDGHRVEVVANVNRPEEAAMGVEGGAEGIGLVRTEFLYLGRDEAPTEDEQHEALVAMVRTMNGLPTIVRTLDIGGDKNAPYLDLPAEDNSFLGIRGIRLCLQRPELFLPQLRAIYRASSAGPLSIMFPMVSRLEDLEQALVLAEQARTEVGAEPVDVGIMIEVPSAAVMARELAKRVQFFSIGTNDLTQYVLAMDRLNPALARQTDALHPAVLRLVKQVVDAADEAGIWVGVCGGVAGEPEGASILTGLGVRELSVSPPAVAAVKAHLREQDFAALQALATKALACATAPEVRALGGGA